MHNVMVAPYDININHVLWSIKGIFVHTVETTPNFINNRVPALHTIMKQLLVLPIISTEKGRKHNTTQQLTLQSLPANAEARFLNAEE